MRWRISRKARGERGASAVEFALVLIPLLMVIAGVVNFGVVFAQQLALDNSVRAGARAGVVDRGAAAATPATLTQNQYNSSALARSLSSAVTVTNPGGVGTTCQGSTFGALYVVRGTVTTRFLIPWPLPRTLLPRTVTLASQAEFQCEYS
jgi:Flp pilus assembly protein TadG